MAGAPCSSASASLASASLRSSDLSLAVIAEAPRLQQRRELHLLERALKFGGRSDGSEGGDGDAKLAQERLLGETVLRHGEGDWRRIDGCGAGSGLAAPPPARSRTRK